MQGPAPLEPLRTRIYIDGYNFYYGCLRNTAFKWLDPLALFEHQIIPSITVTDHIGRVRSCRLLASPAIKFFTARIVESVAKDVDSVASQARYHTALRKFYGAQVELIEGYYAVNPMKVRLLSPSTPKLPPRECEMGMAWKVEEKQSDVNLALHAYHDAITDNVDHVVIATNDTDLAPALEMIRRHTNVRIGLVVPATSHHRHANTELANHAHWVRSRVSWDELAASQLPRIINGGRQATLKPESWYAHPQELKHIFSLIIPITGSRGAAFRWLEAINDRLENQTPMELLATPAGFERVLGYISNWLEFSRRP